MKRLDGREPRPVVSHPSRRSTAAPLPSEQESERAASAQRLRGRIREKEEAIDGFDAAASSHAACLHPTTPHSALHVPHLWSDIVQLQHHSGAEMMSQLPAVVTSAHASSSSSRAGRAKSASAKAVERTPLSAAYFASLLPSDKEQQKHVDRQARHAHDVRCHRDAVISVLSCILEQLFPLRAGETLPSDASLITMFHTERVPSIPISSYLCRLAQYTECSSEVLIQSIIHINRILHHRPSFKVNSLNIHRLLLTSLLCSAKFFDDCYYNNAYYAKVGGIGVKELNELEIEFLALINFDLFVHFPVYATFYAELGGEKLHQHCRCHYRRLPLLDATLYAMPQEYDGQHDVLEEEEEGEVDDEDLDVEEALRATTAPTIDTHMAPSDVRTPMRSTSLPASLSPTTTASSSASSDVEDTDVGSDEEEEVEEDDGADEESSTEEQKPMALSTSPPPVLRSSSTGSTHSVAASLDHLAVRSTPKLSNGETTPPAPAPTTTAGRAAVVARMPSQAQSELMSDSPPLSSRPSSSSVPSSVGASLYPTYPPVYFLQVDYHSASLSQFHGHPLPPPPPPLSFLSPGQSLRPLQAQQPPLGVFPLPFFPPPPPPPQLPHPMSARGGVAPPTSRAAHRSHPPEPLHHTPLLGSVM